MEIELTTVVVIILPLFGLSFYISIVVHGLKYVQYNMVALMKVGNECDSFKGAITYPSSNYG